MSKKKWPKGMTRFAAAPYHQMVYMTTSRKKFKQACLYIDPESTADGSVCGGMTATFDLMTTGGIAVVIGWFTGEPSTLAHECSHAVWKILGITRVRCETDNNEAFAYLLGDMVNKFWSKRK